MLGGNAQRARSGGMLREHPWGQPLRGLLRGLWAEASGALPGELLGALGAVLGFTLGVNASL